ncbi:MAG: type I DNA topoisomerase [Clostridia bacterium]|nr:type I DNA topoisomerase [Clostridia bacterium]
MASNLVIVESPSKATTIKSFLGSGYKVVACQGHIRDLPKSTLGVDLEKDFTPKYINIRGKGELIAELKKEAKNADKVFLASDPDREGEAISWHLYQVLGLEGKGGGRISFNEITKPAVKSAIANPRPIDMALVDSQQTRRILDRIVGYKLSPLLWKNVQNGLSAGRVQSVATRLIVDREREIRAFVPEEYWTLAALLQTPQEKEFIARFHGTLQKKTALPNEESCAKVMASLKGASFSVKKVETTSKIKNPPPPFTTSQLQQEAFKRLGFPSKKTMRIAQSLYEGINLGKHEEHGLITYMRTDSLRVSAEAQAAAKEMILKKFGDKFYPSKPRVYRAKGTSQDAHEAIRPTDPFKTPESLKEVLTSEQYRLYKLIWDRFAASQMVGAKIDVQNVDIEADCSDGKKYRFKAGGETVRFHGFLKVYGEIKDDEEKENFPTGKLPALQENDPLVSKELMPKQNFTQPPRRYNEASLVDALEEKGIGRPSTYAPTIDTILNRGYVKRDKKQFIPTKLGEVTNDIMEKHFATVVDYEFTANLEKKLDDIAEKEASYHGVMTEFYGEFKNLLTEAEKVLAEEGKVLLPSEELDEVCPNCGRKLIVKTGRFGKFAACPGYPECKTTMNLDRNGKIAAPAEKKEDTVVEGMTCEICGGPVVLKKGRFGEFYACANYPKCRFTRQKSRKIGVACPKCGGEIVEKHSRKSTFYGCDRYPECDFSLWDEPIGKNCPECGGMLVKKKNGAVVCSSKDCKYKEIEGNR